MGKRNHLSAMCSTFCCLSLITVCLRWCSLFLFSAMLSLLNIPQDCTGRYGVMLLHVLVAPRQKCCSRFDECRHVCCMLRAF